MHYIILQIRIISMKILEILKIIFIEGNLQSYDLLKYIFQKII